LSIEAHLNLFFIREGNDASTLPYDLVDLILSHAIGQVIFETVDDSSPIPRTLAQSWSYISDLAGVSSYFRAIVLKLVALAFRIPLPRESQRSLYNFPPNVLSADTHLHSILREGYRNLRSLLLFKGAASAGAVMDPPDAWQSQLMQAYGYYLKTRYFHQGRLPRHWPSAVWIHGRNSDIYVALSLCNGTVGGLSYPLVDALHSELQASL
jgi:hypothetical protein